MSKPKFKVNQTVSFNTYKGVKTGVIRIIDPNGYFGSDNNNPHYDIYVKETNTLHKHVEEIELLDNIIS